MARHAVALLPAGWHPVAEHRSTISRTIFVWFVFSVSLLIALLAVAAMLGDSPWLAAAMLLIVFVWWRTLRPMPGLGARLLLCREGIAYSEWPFRALPWQEIRETELICTGEAQVTHRIRLLLEKHYTLPQNEKSRLALAPAGIPDVIEIVPDTLDVDVRDLHETIAELLARHKPESYPGRRLARGLRACE